MPGVLDDPTFGPMFAQLQPTGREKPQSVDWDGFGDALRTAGLLPAGVQAMTWARFSDRPIAALTEGTSLVGVFTDGVFACLGKRRMFSRGPRFRLVDFTDVDAAGAVDHIVGQHRIHKFCIEFTGAGGVLLGRLEWHAQARRSGGSGPDIMAAARERDRLLVSAAAILGGGDRP